MIRTLVDHLGAAAAYVVVLALGAIALQVLVFVRARTKNLLVQRLLDFAATIARQTTLALAASVRDLKDPAKPGAWSPEAANETAQKAVQAVLNLAGPALTQYLALSGARGVEPAQVARQLVEAAVEEHRRAAPLVARVEALNAVATPLVDDPGDRPTAVPTAPLTTAMVLVGLLFAGCEQPSQHDAARWGTIEVQVDGFTNGDTRLVRQALVNLSHLGPSFVEARSDTSARLAVVAFVSNNCSMDVMHWSPALGTFHAKVELDPSCMSTDEEFRQAVQHGIGHVLRLGHLCGSPGELPDCAPTGYGPAVMGAHVREVNTARRAHVFTGVASRDTPSLLDLQEFNRLYAPDGGTIRP